MAGGKSDARWACWKGLRPSPSMTTRATRCTRLTRSWVAGSVWWSLVPQFVRSLPPRKDRKIYYCGERRNRQNPTDAGERRGDDEARQAPEPSDEENENDGHRYRDYGRVVATSTLD